MFLPLHVRVALITTSVTTTSPCLYIALYITFNCHHVFIIAIHVALITTSATTTSLCLYIALYITFNCHHVFTIACSCRIDHDFGNHNLPLSLYSAIYITFNCHHVFTITCSCRIDHDFGNPNFPVSMWHYTLLSIATLFLPLHVPVALIMTLATTTSLCLYIWHYTILTLHNPSNDEAIFIQSTRT